MKRTRFYQSELDLDQIFSATESRLAYLYRLRHVKFVVSPPGNGIDCFRTWEALAMGCVPIVLNTSINAIYRNLPVMIVNAWTEVNDVALEQFEQALNLTHDDVIRTEMIYADYWRRRILDSRDL